jgi:hypothetical protein
MKLTRVSSPIIILMLGRAFAAATACRPSRLRRHSRYCRWRVHAARALLHGDHHGKQAHFIPDCSVIIFSWIVESSIHRNLLAIETNRGRATTSAAERAKAIRLGNDNVSASTLGDCPISSRETIMLTKSSAPAMSARDHPASSAIAFGAIALSPATSGERAPPQFCMPHRRTVTRSILRKIKFSTSRPIRITVNRPAKTEGISSWFLAS